MTTQCSYCLTPEGSIIVTPKQIAEVAAAWKRLCDRAEQEAGRAGSSPVSFSTVDDDDLYRVEVALLSIGLLPSEDPLCRP